MKGTTPVALGTKIETEIGQLSVTSPVVVAVVVMNPVATVVVVAVEVSSVVVVHVEV